MVYDMQEISNKLSRIDERTINIYTLTEKQERHLSEINGKILDQAKLIEGNTNRSQRNQEIISWILKIAVTSLFTGGLATVITKCIGLW